MNINYINTVVAWRMKIFKEHRRVYDMFQYRPVLFLLIPTGLQNVSQPSVTISHVSIAQILLGDFIAS